MTLESGFSDPSDFRNEANARSDAVIPVSALNRAIAGDVIISTL